MERSEQNGDVSVLELLKFAGDELDVGEYLFVLPCALGDSIGNAEGREGGVAGGLYIESYAVLAALLVRGDVPVPCNGRDTVVLVEPLDSSFRSVVAPVR